MKLTPQQIAAGWTEAKLDAFLVEADRRLSARIDAVFNRRPPLKHERLRSAHDWTRKGSAYNWWRRDLKGELKRGD